MEKISKTTLPSSSHAKATEPTAALIKQPPTTKSTSSSNNNNNLKIADHLKVKRCKHGRIIVKDASKKKQEPDKVVDQKQQQHRSLNTNTNSKHTLPTVSLDSHKISNHHRHHHQAESDPAILDKRSKLITPRTTHADVSPKRPTMTTLTTTTTTNTTTNSRLTNEPIAHPASSSDDNNSPNSDIYDPEGPIIPISPVDSPPLSLIDETAYSKIQYHLDDDKSLNDDDVPSSAVQLNQQEKYLQKLNRQERVIEEVKIALKPHYQRRLLSKEQYKDVLRRAVPKICHSKNGQINPVKIRSLIEAYVEKITKRRRSRPS